MDAPLTWDGTDWQGFATLEVLNPDAFSDLQHSTGLSHEELIEIIKRMQSGDRSAYNFLIDHMGKVGVGQKIHLLTAEGFRKLLAYNPHFGLN